LLFKEQLVIQTLLNQSNLGHPHWLYLESFLEFSDIMWANETELAFSMRTMRKTISANTYLLILEQLHVFMAMHILRHAIFSLFQPNTPPPFVPSIICSLAFHSLSVSLAEGVRKPLNKDSREPKCPAASPRVGTRCSMKSE
jgi:hypothetical protein